MVCPVWSKKFCPINGDSKKLPVNHPIHPSHFIIYHQGATSILRSTILSCWVQNFCPKNGNSVKLPVPPACLFVAPEFSLGKGCCKLNCQERRDGQVWIVPTYRPSLSSFPDPSQIINMLVGELKYAMIATVVGGKYPEWANFLLILFPHKESKNLHFDWKLNFHSKGLYLNLMWFFGCEIISGTYPGQ